MLVFGLIILLIGLLLRVLAIITLGTMWSYRVALLEQHKFINEGIYKHVKHPAYIGNIYLAGLSLSLCAPISSIISMFLIAIFYLIRVPEENKILLVLKKDLI